MYACARRRPLAACWIVGVLCLLALMPFGCADADRAEPETRRFAYAGDLVNVRSYGASAEVVVTGREDIRVTRWFDRRFGASGDGPVWDLDGDGTLNLKAGCTGFANCEARFRVEVPKGVTVLRDGEPTRVGASR